MSLQVAAAEQPLFTSLLEQYNPQYLFEVNH